MKIHKTDIPPRSLLTPCLPGDYHDCFTYGMTCRRKISPDDLMVAFWTTMPGWADTLFKLRNALVRPFGLQTDNGDAKQREKAIRSGRAKGKGWRKTRGTGQLWIAERGRKEKEKR